MLLIGLGLFVFGAGNSYASMSYSDSYNFSGSGTLDGRDYLELSGNVNPFIFSYNHNVTFIPPAASVTSAQVLLSHNGNSNTPGELWFLEGTNHTLIGKLDKSTQGNN